MNKAILTGHLIDAWTLDNNNTFYLSFTSNDENLKFVPEMINWINSNYDIKITIQKKTP